MILQALLSRTRDGLPLTTSTDHSFEKINSNLKEIGRYLKMVSNRASNLPYRCILQLKDCKLLLVTDRGVSGLAAVSNDYSSVLAFSFLNELLNEYSSKHNSNMVDSARRPYQFIEFGDVIERVRQSYSKPQGSLISRLDISALTSELNSRPPYNIRLSEIEPLRNGYHQKNTSHLGVGASPKFEPLPWYSIIAMLPNILLIFLGFYRSLSSFQVSSFEVHDGPTPLISLLFLIESFIRMFQLYLLLYYRRYREAESWFCTAALFGCVFLMWDLRSSIQQVLFVMTTMAMHACTISRRLQDRRPDYNV